MKTDFEHCFSEEVKPYHGLHMPPKVDGGLRYNDGKSPINLIPPQCILALGQHYGKGAKKYSIRNWEKGMDWTICYDSLMRHSLAWMSGEDYDVDATTGEKSHHMIAVAWNALALFWYSLKNVGKDDRPKYGKVV